MGNGNRHFLVNLDKTSERNQFNSMIFTLTTNYFMVYGLAVTLQKLSHDGGHLTGTEYSVHDVPALTRMWMAHTALNT